MERTGTPWRAILFWGTCWGILESTVGALLHLLPVRLGFLVWVPMAMGCMLGAYRATGKTRAVLFAAAIAAAFKLTNLFFPIRVDKVLNPAVSILLEGLSLAALLALCRGVPAGSGERCLFALGINTLWRGEYLLYLLLTTAWIREISVLASTSALMRHLVWDNLASTAVLIGLMALLCRRPVARDSRVARAGTPLLLLLCAANLILQWTL